MWEVISETTGWLIIVSLIGSYIKGVVGGQAIHLAHVHIFAVVNITYVTCDRPFAASRCFAKSIDIKVFLSILVVLEYPIISKSFIKVVVTLPSTKQHIKLSNLWIDDSPYSRLACRRSGAYIYIIYYTYYIRYLFIHCLLFN